MKKISFAALILIFLVTAIYFLNNKSYLINRNQTDMPNLQDEAHYLSNTFPPLSIDALRNNSASWRTGSDIVIEQTLDPGSNYNRYIASYKSEGLKIYGLLTVPREDSSASPQNDNRKYPVIIFNHGFIPPAEYRSTERYLAYVDGFARNGYIVFRPDYRGHGNSEGQATGAYGSNAYTIDVLNAVASIKKLNDPSTGSGQIVNPNLIGMWGHSLGGFITLRSMVTSGDIKAGVIWAGVVASYPDLLRNWRRGPTRPFPTGRQSWRQLLVQQFGELEENPQFWNSISANSYLADISGPLQLHHGESDSSVPVAFSEKLAQDLKQAGKTLEIYTYPGDDHNISGNFNTAMQRSIDFFDKYLKNN